ncbi:MAG: 3-phosphoshikimate 1-carboxyvinyltransferase, partial [Chloroflexi bacterium]|nr:3-phosphoshikimate 1-carboxyvinyltransferase [Chloroflexota bacterium]
WVSLKRPLSGTFTLSAFDITVPADISSAAFPLVAAATVPHSQVTLVRVGMNDTRTGSLDMMKAMGATFTVSNEQVTGGEPVADLTVTFDELHNATIKGQTVVRGIDELPVWAVAASQGAGASTVYDAAELRVKEVDRISMLAGELQKLGVKMSEHADGFTIDGPIRLHGADVDSHDDHRLGMSLAVAGLVANSTTIVHDATCIADSFPGFVELMQSLGAHMSWLDD